MTTQIPSTEASRVAESAISPGETETSRFETFWQGVDRQLSAWGDYLNPILVKETRQALKSRQFTFTFLLVLLVSWVITIAMVAYLGPGIAYAAAGGHFLLFYCYLLSFPLAVIVPFTAFRSLAAEREENTYDLLRVSTLSPRQVVNGKLGSTLVQIGVYVSALAPCLAFTYLLRGIDVVSIVIVLAYIVLASVGLSMVGLLAAAAAPHKQGQVVLSVGFVTLLLGCFFGGMGGLTELLTESYWVQDNGFWIMTWLVFSLYATTLLLAYLATVSLTSPRTVNKSTPLRWGMLVQQAVFYGWLAYALLFHFEYEAMFVCFCMLAIYWYLMGTLLSSESPDLSHRVQRELPQSILGRWFLGWLNPGPGTGYMFAVIHVTTGVLTVTALGVAHYQNWIRPTNPFGGGMPANDLGRILPPVIAIWCYVVIYLGIGKLVVATLRRFSTVGVLAAFLLHIILVMIGAGVPYGIQMSVPRWRDMGFNAMQWPNPFWGAAHTVDNMVNGEIIVYLSVLVGTALSVLLVNMPSVAREIVRERIALPTRIAQEEAEMKEALRLPQSPWDEASAAAAKPRSMDLM